ncbi:MAG: DUF2085 domain-containing protein [Euryarchaeota archaeon]|nr:DUF2085 domain-containing protein [Euryarchaeota archaeon]
MLRVPVWVCHQKPERSLFLRGRQLPLCARCTGFYAAAVAGMAVGLWVSLPRLHLLLLLILLVVPMGVDGTTQLVGRRESTNALRLATGALGGFGCGLATLALLLGR